MTLTSENRELLESIEDAVNNRDSQAIADR